MSYLKNFLLCFFIIFSSITYAYDGEKKIRLLGKVKEGIDKRVSVKELESTFETKEFSVYNPYDKQSDLYSGVFIDKLVEKFAQDGVSEVKFTAIDNYEITLSKADWLKNPILLSTRMNGKFMEVREKGPLRIVYPELHPEDKDYKKLLPTWMWMITKIEFK